MLKYSVCRDNFLSKDSQIKVLSSEKRVMLGENGDTKKLLVCECDNIVDFNEGMEVLGLNTVSVTLNTYATMDATYEFAETLVVTGVNSEESTISLLVDKYIELPLSTVALQIIDGVTYAYFYFTDGHYFNDPSFVTEEQIRLYLRYGKLEEDVDIVPNTHVEWINISTLRIEASYLKSRCPDSYYTMFEGVGTPTESEGVSGRIDGITVMRDTFLYEYDEENDEFNYQLFFDRPVQVIKIPLSQEYSTNLFKEIALKEDFVDVEREKSINGIVDTEKVVYYPVIKTADGYDNVYKIIFNFHFREHRGEDWTVEDDAYWNGTYAGQRGSYPSVELMRASEEEQLGFFSYMCSEAVDNALYDESYQSDLLSYLGFANDDVRYQKNKLKKSFIRLSFYDSTNPANQNLLGYSTVFVDSGKLFSRYSTHFEDRPYSYLDSENINTDLETKLGLTGVRVNREPYDTTVSTALSHEDYLENARLSSQLVVQDKYNSTSSSEGFYLYLWRTSTSPEPQDIYMKVEYNHAGYGRSLPMMFPYFEDDEAVGEKGKIKTFDEIVDDWNIADKNGNAKAEDVGYGVRQYLRYSYIHFKYQYDVATKQCIYYLDDEQYGYENLTTSPLDGTLVFNLYEAKIGAQNAEDGNIITYCYGDKSEMTAELTYNKIPAEGGTVKPQITFSVPVYDCNDRESGPIKIATQANTAYTVVFSGCDDKMDENGAVTEEKTTVADTHDVCAVTAVITVGTVSQEVGFTVQQLGLGEESFRYTDVSLSLEYPDVSGCGETVSPLLSYSYNRTSSYGECIYVEHVYREVEEGEDTACGTQQNDGTYLFYRWCECDTHYDDDVVWTCLDPESAETAIYDTAQFEFQIDNEEFVDDNSEETGGTGNYGINSKTGAIRVETSNTSGNMASLGTVTVTMECGTGTYRDKCEVYQDTTDVGESDYTYYYCDGDASILEFNYNNGAVLPSGDGVYYPTLEYQVLYKWADCSGNVQTGYSNEGGDVEYSFTPDTTSAANSDPEMEDAITGKLVVGTADERGEDSTDTTAHIGTAHVIIRFYDDDGNAIKCNGADVILTADYEVSQSLERDICSYGDVFATLTYLNKIPAEGGESCPTLVCGQNVTYCNGATGTIELNPTDVIYNLTPTITGTSVDSVTGCVSTTSANEGLDDRLVGNVSATLTLNGTTITTPIVLVYQEGEPCVYNNPELEISVRNG